MKTASNGHASNPKLRNPGCGSAAPSSSPKASTLERDAKRARSSSARNGQTKMLSPPLTPLMSKNGPVVETLLESQQTAHGILEEDIRLCGSQFNKPRNLLPTPRDMDLDRPAIERNTEPVLHRTLERVRPPDIGGKANPREYEALAPIMQQSPPFMCEADPNGDDLFDQTGDSSISSSSPRSSIGPETSCPSAHDIGQPVSMGGRPVPEKTKAVGNGPQQGDSTSKGGGAGQTSSKKRQHKAAFEDTPGSDLGDERAPITRRRTQESDKGPEPLLACPFYKKDRQKYQKCLHYQLRRIKDVKQHISRCHSQPEFYCARCYDIFESAMHRDEHTRNTRCEIRDPPQFDGVSPEEKKRLNQQYSSRGKSVEGQWHDMWDIIFPGAQRPESVYVGTYIHEAIQLLRAVWGTRGSEILSRVVRTDRPGSLDRDDLDDTIRLLLDSLSTTSEPASELGGAAMSPPSSPSPPSPCESYPATVFDAGMTYTGCTSSAGNTGFDSSQAGLRDQGVELANHTSHCDVAGMGAFAGSGSLPVIFDGQWVDLLDEGFDFLDTWVKDENI